MQHVFFVLTFDSELHSWHFTSCFSWCSVYKRERDTIAGTSKL